MDILNVVESEDLKKKEKIDFADKNLDQMTLPEQAHVLQEMMSYIEDNEELTEEEKKVADKINGSIENKILAWGYIIKKLQDSQLLIKIENDFYEQKIKDNKQRQQVLQGRINSRAVYISELMHQIGKKKVEGANYSVGLHKQQPELTFNVDIDQINWSKYDDTLYEKVPESIKPNKNEIKKYCKANVSDDFSLSEKPLKLVIK